MTESRHKIGTLGWFREQQIIKAQKDGFDNIEEWSKHKTDVTIKRINRIKKIFDENKANKKM